MASELSAMRPRPFLPGGYDLRYVCLPDTEDWLGNLRIGPLPPCRCDFVVGFANMQFETPKKGHFMSMCPF